MQRKAAATGPASGSWRLGSPDRVPDRQRSNPGRCGQRIHASIHQCELLARGRRSSARNGRPSLIHRARSSRSAERLPAARAALRLRAHVIIGRALPARRAEEYLAYLAGPALLPLLVEDPKPIFALDVADRAAMLQPLPAADDGCALAFGPAIEL